MNIEKDLSIDKFNLDKEAVEHSSKLFQYSEMLTEEKKNLSDIELQLEIQSASVARQIRSGDYPGTKDLKLTEGVVKEIVSTDQTLVDLQRKIIEQKAYVAKLAAVVDAFQHRKYMIIKTIDLFLANYFTDIKPSKTNTSVDMEQLRGLASEAD